MNLVVGATGFLGSEICRQLVAQGQSVRALVRATSDPTKKAALAAATDPIQPTFAALMLATARGDAIDWTAAQQAFPLRLTSMAEFVRRQS